MTRTTLKAVWVGGGGLLATWLAVTPDQTAPASAPVAAPQAVEAREPAGEDLREQTRRLRERSSGADVPAATRNPFRFGARQAPVRTSTAAPESSRVDAVAGAHEAAAAPTFTLSGVAESQVAGEIRRTAVISSQGEIYLVHQGESLGGRYTVVTIDPEAVLLRDAAGAELRLLLPH